ncbi:MAG: SRPBCC family protein [Gemmatimonadota bacterium]
MDNGARTGSTRNSRVIGASREACYRAFTDADSLGAWLAPEGMTGRVHEFDPRVGGGYRMSLFYDSPGDADRGKTTGNEDRFAARFLELDPPRRIVQVIEFESDDPAFSGSMTMTVLLHDHEDGTEVTIAFDGIPPGIRPEDNEAGTRSSLEKLALRLEGPAR